LRALRAHITLRLVTDEDADALARLAALYDRPLASGPLLLAEVDGKLQAALTLTGAQELMEPYLPTGGGDAATASGLPASAEAKSSSGP
jgi:hypothetical protein